MAQLEQEPSIPKSVRRPRFPGETGLSGARKRQGFSAPLMDSDSKFVDPHREAQLILPEQTVASAQLALEIMAPKYSVKKQETGAFFSLYEYLMSIFQSFKKRLKGSNRKKARLTKRGEETLAQLKYLSQLCDATSCRTPEEILEAEGAFGEAYYEIMQLSSNLEKMSQKEQQHHLHHYSRHMTRILQSD